MCVLQSRPILPFRLRYFRWFPPLRCSWAAFLLSCFLAFLRRRCCLLLLLHLCCQRTGDVAFEADAPQGRSVPSGGCSCASARACMCACEYVRRCACACAYACVHKRARARVSACLCVRAGGRAGGRVGEFMVASCVVACCTLHVVGCMSYRAFCRRGLRAKVARGPGRHATRYNAMQQGTMQCSKVQRSATRYNALQQGTIQCNKLQGSATRYNAMEQGTMQCNKQCVPHAQRAGVALHTAHPLRGRPLSARCAALAHAVHVARAGSTLLRRCVLSHVCISLVASRSLHFPAGWAACTAAAG